MFVRPSVRPSTPQATFRPEWADLRPKRADFRPEKADSRPETADFRPERAAFSPKRADFRPERAWGDKQTNERRNKSPPVFYRTSSRSGPLPERGKVRLLDFAHASTFSCHVEVETLIFFHSCFLPFGRET